jgi:hypothetical protein
VRYDLTRLRDLLLQFGNGLVVHGCAPALHAVHP